MDSKSQIFAGVPDEMAEWWVPAATLWMERAAAKAEEYGSRDLQIMGAALPGGTAHAIAFYALGKVARAISSYERGVTPSDDTLRDLAIYAFMLWRVHTVGRWP